MRVKPSAVTAAASTLVVIGLLWAGCSGNPAPVTLAGMERPPTGEMEGRYCNYRVNESVYLPEVSEFLEDELPLRSVVRGLARDGLERDVELSIRYDFDGRLQWVEPLEQFEGADSLRAAVFAQVPRHMEPDWTVRLFIRPDARRPQLQIRHSSECPLEHLTAMNEYEVPPVVWESAAPWDLEVRVSRAGVPLGSRFTETVPDQNAAQQLQMTARRGRYVPRIVDGFRVEGRYILRFGR